MKSKFVLYISSIFIIFGFVCSCKNESTPIPRQYAYPRICEFCNDYELVNDGELHIERNKSAVIDVDSVVDNNSRWLTLFYPQYNSKLFITINKTLSSDSFNQILENRIQRFSLNIGGNIYEQFDVENQNGFNTQILRIKSNSANPVMFISTNNKDIIVSGTMYLQDVNAISKPDSIAPIVDYFFHDIAHIAKTLAKK